MKKSKIQQLADFVRFRFQKETKIQKTLPSTLGEIHPIPDDLHPHLQQFLREEGIHSLYTHQLEAFRSIQQGMDTLLVSQTASGKTLSFLLPILNDYLHSPSPFSVLLLYPTKALSRDQESTLGRLLAKGSTASSSTGFAGASGTFGTFDGDTPQEERHKLQQNSDFILTNPDMLHSGILPNHHRQWKGFLSRLKYIVIDEVHTYRGTFGSHVALVFKRLLRVCELYGSYPNFIGLSATTSNPQEHVQSLIGRPFYLIQKDGAPRPVRHFFFINPLMAQSQGGSLYRKGTGSVTVSLIRYAVENNIRTICFCRSRQQVERLYRAVHNGRKELMEMVKPYRGGLLPTERRQLERDLFSGKIKAIITTNALELGIDIGDLDFCLLSGHPGTLSSFWQQVGRVGRKGKEAMIAFVAKESPIDQYILRHPEFIWQTPVEKAWLNPNNPYILLQHLPCAASELPLTKNKDKDDSIFTQFTQGISPLVLEKAIDLLVETQQLALYRDSYRYIGKNYPTKGVNLRGMTDYNVEIYCGTKVIGEIDPIGARGELYKDAIYQHLGRKYMSMDLDLHKKLCRVEEVNVDYYTEAVWESRVELLEEDECRFLHQGKMAFGPIHVHRQPKLYKKIREGSLENIGYGPITLDPFEYETTGFCLIAPVFWQEKLQEVDKRLISAGLYGLSYLVRQVAPSLCMADKGDIQTDTGLMQKEKGQEQGQGKSQKSQQWKTALYVYDSCEGGVGYAEKIYEGMEKALEICLEILQNCSCEYGCPSCVPSLPPGVDKELNKDLENFFMESNAVVESSVSLVQALLRGTFYSPQVKNSLSSFPPPLDSPEEDQELLKLTSRLQRASKILELKREREY